MNGAFHVPPLTVPPVFADGQSRRESPKMASRPFQFWEKNLSAFCECVHRFGTFCPEVRRGTREGLSYTPCLLMKPTLCLRLHDTQSQPCFPAASNALALPVGNLIFAATPTERITHYTLQAKSCAKGGTPLETLDNKTGGMLPSPGAYRRLLSAARFTVCV